MDASASLSTAEFNATPAGVESLTEQLASSVDPVETEVDEPEEITNLVEKPDDQVRDPDTVTARLARYPAAPSTR